MIKNYSVSQNSKEDLIQAGVGRTCGRKGRRRRKRKRKKKRRKESLSEYATLWSTDRMQSNKKAKPVMRRPRFGA